MPALCLRLCAWMARQRWTPSTCVAEWTNAEALHSKWFIIASRTTSDHANQLESLTIGIISTHALGHTLSKLRKVALHPRGSEACGNAVETDYAIIDTANIQLVPETRPG